MINAEDFRSALLELEAAARSASISFVEISTVYEDRKEAMEAEIEEELDRAILFDEDELHGSEI